MRPTRSCIFLVAALLTSSGSRAADHDLGEALPGPAGVHTAWIVKRLSSPSPRHASPGPGASDEAPLRLDCLATPGRPKLVGVAQSMVIAATVEQVAAVIDDFDHYAEVVPDLVGV